MFLNNDFKDLLETFNAHSVDYLLVDGYAVGFHAQPRATNDLDLWIRADAANAEVTYRAFGEFGAPLQNVKVEDFEAEGYWYSFGNPPLRVDILMSVTGVAFEHAWRNRTEIVLDGTIVPLISIDDLLANKRAVGRARDLADLEDLERAKAVNTKSR